MVKRNKNLLDLYDLKKFNEEDKRYLLGYTANSAMFNSNMRQNNIALFISILSLFFSVFAISFSIVGRLTLFLLIFIGISILILVVFGVIIANKRTNKIISNCENDHNNIFRKHFEYALKKK